ncbi:MAG: lysozyme [Alphaproteobacteria bacterium]|nr:lysozyme [Alphaproteobacteria bacterium]
MPEIPQEALDLVKIFEGLRLSAYLCPAGKWTIGYGHTRGVAQGQAITKEQAEAFLVGDLTKAAIPIDQCVDVPLSRRQFAALISFVFNVGAGNFKRSTLLKQLNQGLYDRVPAQLARWNKSKGRVLDGLSRRRAAEAALWKKGSTTQQKKERTT